MVDVGVQGVVPTLEALIPSTRLPHFSHLYPAVTVLFQPFFQVLVLLLRSVTLVCVCAQSLVPSLATGLPTSPRIMFGNESPVELI